MKNRLLPKMLLLAAVLTVGVVFFAKSPRVKADTPTYYVYVDGYYLGEGDSRTGLYYIQKTHTVTDDNSSDWNARYVPSSGTLYLKNYVGDRIICLNAHGDKPFKVVLEGTNVINSSSGVGIKVSTSKSNELTITSVTSGGSLAINVADSSGSYCAGIENYYSGTNLETVYIQNTAAVTVNVNGARSYGIRAGGTVYVIERGSVDVNVTYTDEAKGFSAAVYTATGDLAVSTTGAVNFSAVARDDYANTNYGFAFYSGNTGAEFTCDVKSFPYVSLSSVGYHARISNLSSVADGTYNSNLEKTYKQTGVTESLLLMYYNNRGVPVTGATFPDTDFRALVKTFDENNDGYLSQLEIDEITEIYVTNEEAYDQYSDAYSLMGIEYLTALHSLTWDLDVFDTGIRPGNFIELDLRSNLDLAYVSVRGGSLRELYVRGLPILKWLDCSHNLLHGPDLSKLTMLTDVMLHDNLLTDLYLSGATSLEYLDISDNSLSSANLSSLTKLQYLYCNNNKLESLDLSKLTKLVGLSCGGNPFTSLSLTNNTKLAWLYCTDSSLTTLNLSKNTSLMEIDVHSSGSLKTLTLGTNSLLERLRCIDCVNLASLNISGCSNLRKTVGNKKGFAEDGVNYIQYATYDEYGDTTYCIQADLGLVLFYRMPKAQNVKTGAEVTFSCKAAGNGKVTYQWQYQVPGESTWKNVSASSGKTSNYTLTVAPRHDGYVYRCKVTSMYDKNVYSSKVTLRVLGIKTQPSSVSTLSGKTVKFKVTATGPDLVYQWQYKKPGESTWQNVSAASGKTAAYSLTAQERHNGYQYRCRVKNSAGTVWSKAATLTIIVQPEITKQPASISTTAGKLTAFTVKATGGALSYQWQYKKPGETTWQNVSAASGKTAKYSLTVEARHNGYQYRCKVTNAAGSVTSVAVKLTVK